MLFKGVIRDAYFLDICLAGIEFSAESQQIKGVSLSYS